ncbi:hypothetical protein OH76DRAFT_1233876 [Lentinus brumalis]|uniref:Uncharacterized protein n=1 Tax=Lentinus brumalis TaxID=2498619 RepID=A0A371CSJ4_9APHY|nr:hypothetical protein OH76DRAFT_1233876 [Polyporus brumalis]
MALTLDEVGEAFAACRVRSVLEERASLPKPPSSPICLQLPLTCLDALSATLPRWKPSGWLTLCLQAMCPNTSHVASPDSPIPVPHSVVSRSRSPSCMHLSQRSRPRLPLICRPQLPRSASLVRPLHSSVRTPARASKYSTSTNPTADVRDKTTVCPSSDFELRLRVVRRARMARAVHGGTGTRRLQVVGVLRACRNTTGRSVAQRLSPGRAFDSDVHRHCVCVLREEGHGTCRLQHGRLGNGNRTRCTMTAAQAPGPTVPPVVRAAV